MKRSIFNSKFSDLSNLNALSKSFDFLRYEPDLYSKKDVQKVVKYYKVSI